MEASVIAKYKKYTTAQLKKKAIKVFNAWIRERDKNDGCISCGGSVDHAGHYFSGGHYDALRFDERNVSGQCVGCNTFRHGNILEYRRGLLKKIGQENLDELESLAQQTKKKTIKQSRFYFIELIENYKL